MSKQVKTALLIAGAAVLVIYIVKSVDDSNDMTHDIFDWVNALVGMSLFFFGVYYVMYGRFPFFIN